VNRDSDQQRIAAAARERGWSYERTMPALQERWTRSPFRASATNPPFGRIGKRSELIHVVSGTSRGRQFWTFEWVEIPMQQTDLGTMIAFISAGRELPPVSVAPLGLLQAAASSGLLRASRRATWHGQGTDPRERLLGPDIGDDEFRKHFHIDAQDKDAAAWLLSDRVRARLVSARWLGLTSRGIDVLCWRGGQFFDLEQLDPMLALLGDIDLPGYPAT
jgi:hypothetical protein